jgi:HEAT repeat protein
MKLTTISRRRLVLATMLIGLVGMAVAYWSHSKRKPRPVDVDALIDQLNEASNKVRFVGYFESGSEILQFSQPMEQLVALGDTAREPLYRRLNEKPIQNEVVLILGAIGDESTVRRLIEAYPEIDELHRCTEDLQADPDRFKVACFSCALVHLTQQSIGYNRWGADFTPWNRQKWQEWWNTYHKVFWVSDEPDDMVIEAQGLSYLRSRVITFQGGWFRDHKLRIETDPTGVPTFFPGNPPSQRTLKSLPQILAQLNKALKDEDVEVRICAVHQFRRLGPKAKDSVANLIVAITDDDGRVREAATSNFYWIGANGEEAIPALLDAFYHDRDDDVRHSAALSLSKVGDQAIPHLVQALQDKDPEVRRLAAWALCNHDPKRKDVIPALQAVSKDEDPQVRASVLGAMEIIDNENPRVFEALLAGLEDPAPVVRRACAWHFWRMGAPMAKNAAEALTCLFHDNDPTVREEAINTLDKIGSLTRKHIPVLIRLLKDEAWQVRSNAAQALGTFGPIAKPAVDDLGETLKDPEAQVRWNAASTLGNIGPDARTALPDLINALEDDDRHVQSNVRDALKKIDPTESCRACSMER